jgi:hypothetical protein
MAPDCRKSFDRTGGLNPFAAWGLTSLSKLDRDSPEYGQRLPVLGIRMKRGTGICVFLFDIVSQLHKKQRGVENFFYRCCLKLIG